MKINDDYEKYKPKSLLVGRELENGEIAISKEDYMYYATLTKVVIKLVKRLEAIKKALLDTREDF